jgi:hypothetical protein
MHRLAHVPAVIRHAPALLDLAAQFRQGPGAQPRDLHLRPVQHHLARRGALLLIQPRPAARTRTVVQTSQPFGVVAQDRVTQRLPLHARQPRGFGPRQPLQGTRNSLHPGRRRAVLLPSRQPPQLRRWYVAADRQTLRTHRVLPSRVGRNQNHFAPCRLKSRPSQEICEPV